MIWPLLITLLGFCVVSGMALHYGCGRTQARDRIVELEAELNKAEQHSKKNAEVLSNRLNSLSDQHKQQKETLKKELQTVLDRY